MPEPAPYTAANRARHADGTCDPDRCPVCADLAEPDEGPVAPAPPVRCLDPAPHVPHYWGDQQGRGTGYRCPGRRARARQPLPELGVDVAWTLTQARRVRAQFGPAGWNAGHLSATGNLLLTMAQVAGVLVDRFTAEGWRAPVLEYTDTLRHLTAAYQSLAAATRQPYVSDGEPANGADPTDTELGALDPEQVAR
jgi:hypothetical protein